MVASAAIVEHQPETQSTTRAAGRIVLGPHLAALTASDVSHVRQAVGTGKGLISSIFDSAGVNTAYHRCVQPGR
jgi:hypothetical protein